MYMMWKVITYYRRKSKNKNILWSGNFYILMKIVFVKLTQHVRQPLKLINDLIFNIQSLVKLANWEYFIFINAKYKHMLNNFEDLWTLNSKCRVLLCSAFTSNIKTWFASKQMRTIFLKWIAREKKPCHRHHRLIWHI